MHAFFWRQEILHQHFLHHKILHIYFGVYSFFAIKNKCTNICDTNNCNAKNFDAKNDVAKSFCVTIFCLFTLATVYSAAYIFVCLIKMTIYLNMQKNVAQIMV